MTVSVVLTSNSRSGSQSECHHTSARPNEPNVVSIASGSARPEMQMVPGPTLRHETTTRLPFHTQVPDPHVRSYGSIVRESPPPRFLRLSRSGFAQDRLFDSGPLGPRSG
jgi:hypothetical protein